ncbi:transcriptional regulator, LysR family [Granulicella rosea]|uniref:Transcriptional regulator, LysR family n=1 Tax=Granulicella rosea TaxID=474952 RepID=A0A239M0P4_9BACT|nr:LysR family transcriptional regulator [Granulicella rosea]SNT36346.1 transcriptional regulator, LysR family [Granulicella rosea]
MELRHLRYFVAVAENKGFGVAARLLSVSQSAISEQVRDLEDEVGTALFDRSNRRIGLTAEGEQFLEDARGILRLADQAVENIQRSLRGEVGTLTIGFFTGGTGSFFPQLIKEFRRRFKGVRVQLMEMPPGLQHRALQNGALDIGFTRAVQSVDARVLSSEHFQTEAIYAVLPIDHPLAKRRSILLRDLAQEQFVLNDRKYSPAVADKIFALCAQAGFSPQLGASATNAPGAIALVQAGEGIAILPGGSRLLNNKDVVFVPLADKGATVELVIAWSSQHETPVIRSFLELARKKSRKTDRTG